MGRGKNRGGPREGSWEKEGMQKLGRGRIEEGERKRRDNMNNSSEKVNAGMKGTR